MSIWNMQGQKLGDWNAGIQARGRHELRLYDQVMHGNKLAVGTYVLLVNVNGKTMKKQFIVTH